MHPPTRPLFQSLVGHRRMQGPTACYRIKKPFEPLKVGVTAFHTQTGEWRVVTSYASARNQATTVYRPLSSQEIRIADA